MTARMAPEARRSQLVDVTLELLGDRAPGELVVDDVAFAAGVSRGLVYRYFSDLDELLVAAYQRFFVRPQIEIDALLHTAPDARTGLLRAVYVYLEFAQANATTYRHLVDGGLALNSDVRRIRSKRFHRLARFLGDDTGALVTATAIVGLLESATLAWLEHGDGDIERGTSLVWGLTWAGVRGVEPGAEPQEATPLESVTATGWTAALRTRLDGDLTAPEPAVHPPCSVIDLDQARQARRQATSRETQ